MRFSKHFKHHWAPSAPQNLCLGGFVKLVRSREGFGTAPVENHRSRKKLWKTEKNCEKTVKNSRICCCAHQKVGKAQDLLILQLWAPPGADGICPILVLCRALLLTGTWGFFLVTLTLAGFLMMSGTWWVFKWWVWPCGFFLVSVTCFGGFFLVKCDLVVGFSSWSVTPLWVFLVTVPPLLVFNDECDLV